MNPESYISRQRSLLKPAHTYRLLPAVALALLLLPAATDADSPPLEDAFRGVTPLPPEVIIRFAPEIRFHSKEDYYPASVDWYLTRCELRFISHQDGDGLWQETFGPSPLTAFSQLLDKASPEELEGDRPINTGDSRPVAGRYVSGWRAFDRKSRREDFAIVHLNLEGPNEKHAAVTRSGLDGRIGPRPRKEKDRTAYYRQVEDVLAASVPAYVWVHYAMADAGIYDIAYHLFRPYQGPTVTRLAAPLTRARGQHEGDWERIVVRIRTAADGDYEIAAVYYSAHGREGGWYMPMSSRMNESSDPGDFRGSGDPGRRRAFDTVGASDHPLVYAALGSHANYTTPENNGRRPGGFNPGFNTAMDALDDKGARWRTWRHLVVINPDGPEKYTDEKRAVLDVPAGMRISKEEEEEPGQIHVAQVAPQTWVNYNGLWGNWLLYDSLIRYRSIGPRTPRFGNAHYRYGIPFWTDLKRLGGSGTAEQRPLLVTFGEYLYQFFAGDDILVSRSRDGFHWRAPAAQPLSTQEQSCPDRYEDVKELTYTTRDNHAFKDWFTRLEGSGASSPSAAPFNNALFMAVLSGSGNDVTLYRTGDGLNWCAYNLTAQTGIEADTQLGIAAFRGRLWLSGKGTGNDAIVYLTSTTDGVRWSPYTPIISSGSPLKSATGPVVASHNSDRHGERLFIAVTSGSEGARFVSLASTGNGLTWNAPIEVTAASPPRRRNPGQTTRSPSLVSFRDHLILAISSSAYDEALAWTATPDGENYLPWSPIRGTSETGPSLEVFNNRMWMITGSDIRISNFIGALPDTVTWEPAR